MIRHIFSFWFAALAAVLLVATATVGIEVVQALKAFP